MKKSISILLVGILCFSSLFGCGKKEEIPEKAFDDIVKETSSAEETPEGSQVTPVNEDFYDTAKYASYNFDVSAMPNPSVFTSDNYYGTLNLYMDNDAMLVDEYIKLGDSHVAAYVKDSTEPFIYAACTSSQDPSYNGFFKLSATKNSESTSLPSAVELLVGEGGSITFASYKDTEEHNGNLYDICTCTLNSGTLKKSVPVDVYINRATQKINRVIKEKDPSNENDVYIEMKTISGIEEPDWVSSAVEDETKGAMAVMSVALATSGLLDDGTYADTFKNASGSSSAMSFSSDEMPDGSRLTINGKVNCYWGGEVVVSYKEVEHPNDSKEFWSDILDKDVVEVTVDGTKYDVLTSDGKTYIFDYDDFFEAYNLDIDAFVNQEIKG